MKYRLTESRLRGMIREAVRGALNEVGDTYNGHTKIGALAGRRWAQNTYDPHYNFLGTENDEKNARDYALRQDAKYSDYAIKHFNNQGDVDGGYDEAYNDEHFAEASRLLRDDLQGAINTIDYYLKNGNFNWQRKGDFQESIRELLERIARYANTFFRTSTADYGISVH